MSDMETKEVYSKNTEVLEISTSKIRKTRIRKPNKYVDDWMKLFLGSSDVILENDHDFRDPYVYCRDAI